MQRLTTLLLFLLLALATLLIWRPEEWLRTGLNACLLVVAAASLAIKAWGGRPPRGSVGLALLAAAVCWLAISTAVGWSVYEFASWRAVAGWSALVAVYLLGRELLDDPGRRRRVLDGYLLFGAGVCALAVVQHPTSSGRFLWVFESGYPDLLGPFQNRNNFAAFVELLAPLALWRAARARRNSWPWLGVTALVVAAVAASSSRAGSVIVAGEVLVVSGLLWRQRIVPRRRLLAGAGVLAGMIVAGLLMAGPELLWQRLTGEDLGYRPEIMAAALDMVAARPWTGFGAGTFETVYPAFARFDIDQVVNYAHNDWLEWAATGGLPFLGLLAAFAIWHLRPAFGSVWGVGVAAVFLHALVDFPLQRLGVAGWVFVMLAAIEAERCSQSVESRASGSTTSQTSEPMTHRPATTRNEADQPQRSAI